MNEIMPPRRVTSAIQDAPGAGLVSPSQTPRSKVNRTPSLLLVFVCCIAAGCHHSASSALERSLHNHASRVEVEGEGVVQRILPDDRNGDPHQRFVLRTGAGDTLRVAHNIGLSSRIEDLREGETVSFRGELDWNDGAAVIHWTHRDPRGRHGSGWLRCRGKTYD